MFAQGVEHSCERQLATVPGTQSPANDLSSFEIQHYCQVVFFSHETQMGKILHPSTGMYHSGVALASLRTLLVTKHRKAFQGVWRGSYLCWRRVAAPLLARNGNGHPCKGANTPGFLLAPAKMQGQSANTVEWVLLVDCNEGSYAALIFVSLLVWCPVVRRTVDMQDASKLAAPSWLDFFQDGYSFGRLVSAVSLPRMR
jgi:hypothetical protein